MQNAVNEIGRILKHLVGSRRFMLPLIFLTAYPLLIAVLPPKASSFLALNFEWFMVIVGIALFGISAEDVVIAWRETTGMSLVDLLKQMAEELGKAIQPNPTVLAQQKALTEALNKTAESLPGQA